jgi:hypothetical protein
MARRDKKTSRRRRARSRHDDKPPWEKLPPEWPPRYYPIKGKPIPPEMRPWTGTRAERLEALKALDAEAKVYKERAEVSRRLWLRREGIDQGQNPRRRRGSPATYDHEAFGRAAREVLARGPKPKLKRLFFAEVRTLLHEWDIKLLLPPEHDNTTLNRSIGKMWDDAPKS